MNGYNPFPSTVLLLKQHDVPYTVKWAKSPNGVDIEDENGLKKLEGLYPRAQLYDNTYKTNNKNLAFFQIVALNHLGKAFSCSFGKGVADAGSLWHLACSCVGATAVVGLGLCMGAVEIYGAE